MKTAGRIKILRLIMISLLLVAITASDDKEVVLDSLGRPVMTNTPYIIRVEFGRHKDLVQDGWITYSAIGISPCPEYVVIDQDIPDYVVFESSPPGVIRVSTAFNIRFPSLGRTEGLFRRHQHCILTGSGYWKVKDSAVGLSGSEHHNDSFFTIEKNNGSYKFAFRGDDIDLVHPGNAMVLAWRTRIPKYVDRYNVSFVR